jgi:Domain of unknown function (DUF4407)
MTSTRMSRGRGKERPGVGLISLCLAYLAGYDLNVIGKYADQDYEHERIRLVRIGCSVLIPAALTCFASYFYLGTVGMAGPGRVLLSCAFGILMLGVDSLVVTTLDKESRAGVHARVALSLCLSAVVAEPALLAQYRPAIDLRNQSELHEAKSARLHRLEEALRNSDAEAARLNERIAKDNEKLAMYQPGNMALRHLAQVVEAQNAAQTTINEVKDAKVARLRKQKSALEADRSSAEQRLHAAIVQKELERAGKGDTGLDGDGEAARSLETQQQSAQNELDNINAQLKAVSDQIQAVERDGGLSAAMATQLSESQRLQDDGSRGSGEEPEKARLEAQISRSMQSLTKNAEQQEQIWSEKRQLEKQYALERNSDSLTQTRILGEIILENPFLMFKVICMFLLTVLVDMTPLIAKLTANTGYEDYIQSLSQQRKVRSYVSRVRYIKSVTAVAREDALSKLTYLRMLREACGKSFSSSGGSRSVHLVEEKLGVELERITARMLNQTQEATPGLIRIVLRWLARFVALAKLKLS